MVSRRHDLHVGHVAPLGGGARAFAHVTLGDVDQADLDDRTKWLHLLTPRNGTTALAEIGFHDNNTGLDVNHSAGGSSTISSDVFTFVPGRQYKVEVRLDDDAVSVYVDNSFVGRFAKLVSGPLTNLLVGTTTGPGDAGLLWLDDVTVTERPLVGHRLQESDFDTPTTWTATPSGTISSSSFGPFPSGQAVRVTSTVSAPQGAQISLEENETDLLWSGYAYVETSGADPSDATTWINILNGTDAGGSEVFAVRLVNGTRIGWLDGSSTTLLGPALTVNQSVRIDVATTMFGYRVWVDGVALADAADDFVFDVGSDEPVSTIAIGGGEGTIRFARLRVEDGEVHSIATAAAPSAPWKPYANDADGITSAIENTVSLNAFTPVSGASAIHVQSTGDSGAYAYQQGTFVLPGRFEASGWIRLASTTFSGMSVFSVRTAIGGELAAARIMDQGAAHKVEVRTGSTWTAIGLDLTAGVWYPVTLQVDAGAKTYSVNVNGTSADGSWTNSSAPVSIGFGDMIVTHTGTEPSGKGEAWFDDIVVRRFNEAPLPVITAPVDGGPHALAGLGMLVAASVSEELVDSVTTLEYRIGDDSWIKVPKQRVSSVSATIPTSPPGVHWYWLNVRATDGDRVAYDSVKFCNALTVSACGFTSQTIGTELTGASEE